MIVVKRKGLLDARHLHGGFDPLRTTAGTPDYAVAVAGEPVGAIMAAAEHHSIEMHNRCVNLNENHLKEAFKVFPRCSQETFPPLLLTP